MTNRKNQVVKGTCTDYTYNGLGLLKHEGFCLFVKDMALGDEAEVVITRMQKDYGYGKIVSLITPSPYPLSGFPDLRRLPASASESGRSGRLQAASR